MIKKQKIMNNVMTQVADIEHQEIHQNQRQPSRKASFVDGIFLGTGSGII